MAILDRTPEWYAARRAGITGTDIPAILGVSRWSSEGDIARQKLGIEQDSDPAQERRFRLGTAMQDLVADEEVIEHGFKLRRVRRLMTHPDLPWAMASLDFERVGERTIVEVKTSSSREWDDGLPESVEAQVRWQMGVARYPAAHVAALRYGSQLSCFDLTHDQIVFEALVTTAEDFRRRLAAGGPFEESRDSIRRKWPLDDGSEVIADDQTVAAVRDLLATRQNKAQVKDREETLVAAIQTRMGPATVMTGPGFRITWKRSRDGAETDWQLVAQGLLATLPEDQRDALVSIQTSVREGSRRFIVRETGETK